MYENAHKTGAETFTTPVYGAPFPPIIVGGVPGDYKVLADVTSARWVEYQILAIANGAGTTAHVVISGQGKPLQPDYTAGATTPLNDDAHGYGEAYAVGINSTVTPADEWRRVTSSEKRVYIRIDASVATYVTLRFRPCLLEIIPGPALTVHPDHAHQMNIARAGKINASLQEMGVPGYAEEQNRGATD